MAVNKFFKYYVLAIKCGKRNKTIYLFYWNVYWYCTSKGDFKQLKITSNSERTSHRVSVKMMMDYCSGKVGYTLYDGGKQIASEEEVGYWFRHGTCDKKVDSACEKMDTMMKEGTLSRLLSFFSLASFHEYHQPADVGVHTVGTHFVSLLVKLLWICTDDLPLALV